MQTLVKGAASTWPCSNLRRLRHKGGRVDAEDAGGFFGGGGSRQHAFDVFALDLLDGEIAADLDGVPRGNRRTNPFGKGRRLHD